MRLTSIGTVPGPMIVGEGRIGYDHIASSGLSRDWLNQRLTEEPDAAVLLVSPVEKRIAVEPNRILYTLDNEADAATGSLERITGAEDGQIVILRASEGDRVLTVIDGGEIVEDELSGQFIVPGGDVTLRDGDMVVCEYNAALGRWIGHSVFRAAEVSVAEADIPAAAVPIHDHPATAIIVDQLGTPTYDDLQDFIDLGWGSGVVSGCEITENAALDGTIDIAAGTGWIRDADSVTSNVKFFDIAATSAHALAGDGVNYVYIDYNSGTPQVASTQTIGVLTGQTFAVIGYVVRDSGHVHIVDAGQRTADIINKITRRYVWTDFTAWVSGLAMAGSTEAGHALAATVTAGQFWVVLEELTTAAVDTGENHAITVVNQGAKTFTVAGDQTGHIDSHGHHFIVEGSTGNDGTYTTQTVTFTGGNTEIVVEEAIPDATADGHIHDQVIHGFYRDGGGGWTQNHLIDMNVTQYDDNSGTLATLTANRYVVGWMFMDFDGHLLMVYGQGDYTSNQADAAALPSTLPPTVSAFSIPIAKIIIQKDETDLDNATIITPFETQFSQSATTVHNDLGGLQGGTFAEYYHFTSAQHTNLNAHLADTTDPHGAEMFVSVKVQTPVVRNVGAAGVTLDAFDATAHRTVYVLNSDGAFQADLNVEKDIIVGGTVDERDIATDGAVLDTALLTTLADAKGDLFVATADNTVARQAIGGNLQILHVNNAQASGVEWRTLNIGLDTTPELGGNLNFTGNYLYDSTRLYVQVQDNLYVNGTIGAGTTPVTFAQLVANASGGTVRFGVFGGCAYSGSTATMYGLSFDASHEKTDPTGHQTAYGAWIISENKGVADAGKDMKAYGAYIKAENSGIQNSATGDAFTYGVFIGPSQPGSGANPAGNFYTYGLFVEDPEVPGGSPTTNQEWCALFEGPVQINSNKPWILGGTATSKGDTYLLYDSANATLDVFVGGAEQMNLGVSAVTIPTIHGINYAPGSDTDTDIFTVDVMGAPTGSWDESMDVFNLTHGLQLVERAGDPNEPAAGSAALYLKQSGGKTTFCIRFNNGGGAADVVEIAQEN